MIDIIIKQITKDYKKTIIFEDGKLVASFGEIMSAFTLNNNIEHLSGCFYADGVIFYYWNFEILL